MLPPQVGIAKRSYLMDSDGVLDVASLSWDSVRFPHGLDQQLIFIVSFDICARLRTVSLLACPLLTMIIYLHSCAAVPLSGSCFAVLCCALL